ncbi:MULTISPECIES: aldehyde dehydrogenase (NADP(+)) [unclassified Roseobacter]|uniref:aldehyde dehydrogenase (NADP(+)) n=1 Tax=unclassified Roseobacter TaxID=196798 RepID=UPI00149323B6|nr:MULTISPECIES: aldehyde dehydrogenase (NADP(+)) [unclassified Roseobacter]MBF9050441.1 aldehyde dehydrogenase family protein [Rhodobacterales bacterium HKCCD4356]NNV26385.1 aldehyde dehydrogenase family protein [Roseobacter sp. HKCCD8192]NNV60443.1 aldehyde dehydrogenase family protein [Roseobacter sp. HKCCD8861]NNV64697.1 aldehyde dehydrogenase family protein [Roseobacter sp. HKCCD8434]NNV68959.1 aldehyde dehydrogenase family protein [Roseobacter sp. HKCCD8474]
MSKGQHLIAGTWIGGEDTFRNTPIAGAAEAFAKGTPALIEHAAVAAEDAFAAFAATSRAERAALLRDIAVRIDAVGDAITEIGTRETGLPAARLEGERGRTVGQLRLFADHIDAGDYLDRRHDPAMPDRTPLPRPELHMIQRPIGPIAVFGASNFPLAFSVAGGDTASALAAGCPVVVKGHEAHPGTSEVVAEAIAEAIAAAGLPGGVFSLVHGGDHAVGTALVTHPLIRAVGFTGSLGAGRTLFDMCANRAEPIPFYGELGSINPVFLMPAALAARGVEIAKAWAGSLTMGAGQFCTNPGVAIAIEGADADIFAAETVAALSGVAAQTMLTDGIASAYRAGRDMLVGAPRVETLFVSDDASRAAGPDLFRVSARDWMVDDTLRHEVFGPAAILVVAADSAEMETVAAQLDGQLTATLQMDDADHDAVRRLLPSLERKAGRILFNGFPTGVEVADAMVHGGPYPASTNFGQTSVGTLAIRRWLRPVCYQNTPETLLPSDLRSSFVRVSGTKSGLV